MVRIVKIGVSRMASCNCSLIWKKSVGLSMRTSKEWPTHNPTDSHHDLTDVKLGTRIPALVLGTNIELFFRKEFSMSFKRKRNEELDESPPEPLLNVNYGPSKPCRYGSACKDHRKLQCSFFHSSREELCTMFCQCEMHNCIFPHPLRRRKVICTKCDGPHLVTYCPKVKCSNCKRYGHIARNCE